MKRKETLLHCLDYDTELKLTESSYNCKTYALPDDNLGVVSFAARPCSTRLICT